MKIDLVSIVGIAAVLLMLANLFFTVTMRKRAQEGVIAEGCKYLRVLVVMFAGGYFVLPFIGNLTVETLRIVVSLIFFFGALYVMLTLRMIHGIIRDSAS